MGKSPGKWIKSVLLGKKSTKSGSTKANESVSTSVIRIRCLRYFSLRLLQLILPRELHICTQNDLLQYYLLVIFSLKASFGLMIQLLILVAMFPFPFPFSEPEVPGTRNNAYDGFLH